MELFKKGFFTGLGLVVITAEEIEKKVNSLVEKGKLTTEEGENLVQDLINKTEKQQHEFQEWFSGSIRKTMDSLDIAGRTQVEDLEARVSSLEDRVSTLESLKMDEGKKAGPGNS